jgi:hypothetical protein
MSWVTGVSSYATKIRKTGHVMKYDVFWRIKVFLLALVSKEMSVQKTLCVFLSYAQVTLPR